MPWTYANCRTEAEQLGGSVVREFNQARGDCTAFSVRWVKYKLLYGHSDPELFWKTTSKANVATNLIPPGESLRYPTFVRDRANPSAARQYRATDADTGAGYNAVTKFRLAQESYEAADDKFNFARTRIADSIAKRPGADSYKVRQPAQEKPGLPVEKTYGTAGGTNFSKSITQYGHPCACLINLRGANSAAATAASAASANPIESHQVAAYYVAQTGHEWIYFFDPNMGEVKLPRDKFAQWWETCRANLDAWGLYPKWTVEYYKSASSIAAEDADSRWLQL